MMLTDENRFVAPMASDHSLLVGLEEMFSTSLGNR